jgi:hypothetical protein
LDCRGTLFRDAPKEKPGRRKFPLWQPHGGPACGAAINHAMRYSRSRLEIAAL